MSPPNLLVETAITELYCSRPLLCFTLQAQALKAGQVVWKAGQPVERVVLVAQGRLAFRFEGIAVFYVA